jgi:hypothetical protein
MSETRKLAALLVADVVGYSRFAGDEDRTLARLRGLRSDLIDPAIAAHHGRIVKRTGDGSIIEFRSVVDAVRCAIEVQSGMVERNAGLPTEPHRVPGRRSSGRRRRGERRRPDGRGRQYCRATTGRRRPRRDLPLGASLLASEGGKFRATRHHAAVVRGGARVGAHDATLRPPAQTIGLDELRGCGFNSLLTKSPSIDSV